MTLVLPDPPKTNLRSAHYSPYAGYNPRIGAYQVVGSPLVEGAVEAFVSSRAAGGRGEVALDIETTGVGAGNWWNITCVTAAFWTPNGVVTALLNPMRETPHRGLLRKVVDNAEKLVFHNCFTGDTAFITRDGVRTLAEVEGQTVQVWADGAWREAHARGYGDAPVRDVTLRAEDGTVEHVLRATGNHRWETVGGDLVTTDDLVAGTLLRAAGVSQAASSATDEYRDGVRHGSMSWSNAAFDADTLPRDMNGQQVADFLHGWLLLGNVTSAHQRARLTVTVTKQEAEWLKTFAPFAGWIVTDFSFSRVTLSEARDIDDAPMAWRVVSVGEPSAPVPVYCVEVPGVERFTLAQGVYTANSSFDIPPMVAHRLLTFDDVNKVWDTLVLARMLRTTDRAGRSLEQLAMRYKLTPDDGITMANVMTAAGFRSSRDGYANMDIDYGTYRDGATSDTAITLRLYDELLATVRAKHDGMRGNPATLPSAESVDALIAGVQRVNQIALRRSASGYKVDRDYRQAYEKALVYDKDRNPVCDSAGNHLNVEEQVRLASMGLTAAYLIPGRGDLLIEHLHTQGELPGDWPRTPTGKLKADKKALERLSSMGHPLTQAHRIVADHHKISGYLDKVLENSTDTGRLHPQIAILGAAASGRMSVSGVELHQFPGIARPVLLADHDPGFSSVDWSSIEPVTMALCAGDRKLLDPFNAGADLYIPVARQAGLIPADVDDETAAGHSGRKVAKVVLLAAMYGQGGKSLAANLTAALKRTVEVGEAYDLRRSVQDAMPDSFAFMDRISEFAERYGAVSTISGRVLDEDAEYLYRAVNHFCQGSAADLLYEATLEIDRRGLSDHVHLWMHDELVVSTSVQAEIENAMQTPPQALRRWARVPDIVLRTDAKALGMHWDEA